MCMESIGFCVLYIFFLSVFNIHLPQLDYHCAFSFVECLCRCVSKPFDGVDTSQFHFVVAFAKLDHRTGLYNTVIHNSHNALHWHYVDK